MRSLNLNSSVNAFVSSGNDRVCSVIRYALELVRSCFIPQLRLRAKSPGWQTQLFAQQRMQPAFVHAGRMSGVPVVTTPVDTGGVMSTTG